METFEEKNGPQEAVKTRRKKQQAPQEARREASESLQILPLTTLETKAVTIDGKLATILEDKASELNSGRRSRKVQPSDILTHLAIKIGPAGLQFERDRSEKVEKSYTLPEIGWFFIAQNAERNKATIEETIEELIKGI